MLPNPHVQSKRTILLARLQMIFLLMEPLQRLLAVLGKRRTSDRCDGAREEPRVPFSI
jgi:hypothetical protein